MNGDLGALRELVERSFESRGSLTPASAPRELLSALDECLALLGSGALRVAEPWDGGWRVHEWLKKAVLLHFRTHGNAVQEAGGWASLAAMQHYAGAAPEAIHRLARLC